LIIINAAAIAGAIILQTTVCNFYKAAVVVKSTTGIGFVILEDAIV